MKTFNMADILSWGPCREALPLIESNPNWAGTALDILNHPALENHSDWKGTPKKSGS